MNLQIRFKEQQMTYSIKLFLDRDSQFCGMNPVPMNKAPHSTTTSKIRSALPQVPTATDSTTNPSATYKQDDTRIKDIEEVRGGERQLYPCLLVAELSHHRPTSLQQSPKTYHENVIQTLSKRRKGVIINITSHSFPLTSLTRALDELRLCARALILDILSALATDDSGGPFPTRQSNKNT
jgi:hypothetical protein